MKLKSSNLFLKLWFILLCAGLVYVAYLELTYPTQHELQIDRNHRKAVGY